MTRLLKILGTCSVVAMATFAASPAFAEGTIAGTSITNTAYVDFQVGGVSQAQQSDGDTFVVDRKINLLVEEVGTVTTEVGPGSVDRVTTFQLTNTSNETLDFLLTPSQLAGGTAAHGGTDSFNVTNLRVFRDNPVTGTVGSYDAGDVQVTFVDELAPDAIARLFILADIPAGLLTGAVAGVQLRATAREGGTAAAQGAAITQTVGANTAGKDTVFADGSGVNDVARDGSHSDDDDYTVRTAALTVEKTSLVLNDPFNGTSNPKLIPGATVQYCIRVTNAAGGANADAVTITDNVPSELTFVAGSIRLNGTVSGGVCQLDGTAGGTFADPLVTGPLGTVTVGTTRTLVFQATVD